MNIILGCLMLTFSMIANADEAMSMNVNSTEPSFVVTLAANPTTGYQWSIVEYDKDLLTLSSSTYQRPQTNLIGAGGQMLFTFDLKKGKSYPKKTNMTFKYARSWESTGATVKKVVVHFDKP